MAHDTQHHSVVALKISIPGDMGSREAKMNREIMAAVRDTSRLLTMLDTFTLAGVNGVMHLVLVYPVRGPSMTMQIYMKQRIPVRKRMAAARPLLLAIQSLHDADIVHCDLNSGSVLWDVGDVSRHTRETIYEDFGRPRKAPPWTDMWKKGEMVKPAQVRDLELLRPSVFLCDFGLAMKSGCSARCRWQSPACYCAPERFHGQGPSFASDMWSYMCLFAELYLGLVPFHGHSSHAAVTSFVCSLGPLPSAWEGAYDAGSNSSPEDLWYDQTQGVDAVRSLQEITRRARPDASEAERELALKVFTKVFCYMPEDRLTAAALLADPDFGALLQMTATED